MNDKISEILSVSAGLGMSIIGFLLIGAALFLIVGIVLVIICGRMKLFKRKNTTWNFFTKLYYPYIPIVLAIFGGILGSLYGLNRSISKNIKEQSSAIIEAAIPDLSAFQNYIDANLDDIKVNGYSTSELVDKYFKKDSTKSEGFIDKLTNKAGKWVFEGVVDGLVSYSSDKIGVDKSSTEGTIKTLQQLDMENLDKSIAKIAGKTIEKQVNGFFNGLYLSQLLNLLLFLVIPIAEIIIYFGFIKKKEVVVS